jgi:uncharacterized protein YbjT (DUF2867 family)
MNKINSIAVIGATGMLGKPVTEELAKAGFTIRTIARSVDKARQILPSEIEVVEGNVKEIASLQKGFEGMDSVYISLSSYPNERNAKFKTEFNGINNIRKAAEAKGIKRIGYLSSLVQNYEGIDWWVFKIKRLACDILNESAIPTTIFYPSSFYENLSQLQLKGNRIMLAGNQKTQSWWIGAHDYGKQVARSFQVLDDENREYSIQGPKPYNFDEAAEVFINHYQPKDLKTLKAPLGIFKYLGWFSNEMDFQYHILYAINHYDEQFQSEQTWHELGKPETTLVAFAKSLD